MDTAPPLLTLQGRLTIPTSISLIPPLSNGQGRDISSTGTMENGIHSSSNNIGLPVTKDTIANVVGEKSGTQEYSGEFKKVGQSAAVVVICSTDAVTSTTESLPITTTVSDPNPGAMPTPEDSAATLAITSSFESSLHNKVTFSVPILGSREQSMSTTTNNSVTSLISQLYTKGNNNVLDHHPGLTDGSFDATYNNNTSFDQSRGFSSDNALIVPEDTINCQLASSLTNSGDVQSLGNTRSESNTKLDDSGPGVVRKYICEHDGCAKTYRYKKDVIRHMKMKHGSQPTRYEQKEVSEQLVRKHNCSQCEKVYAHRKDLLRHQRDVHSAEAIARREASKTNLKKYPCEQPNCNKFYVHKKDLIRHRRNDHNDLTDTKDMHIPEPVSPSHYSSSPAKRQRGNWSGSKVVSAKAETVAEPVSASDVHQWLGVTVVKEGNVNAAAMATSDSNNTGNLASNCALFNTSPSSSNAATSLLSLLNSTSQQALPVDAATAQLMGQTAAVHPLFSAVTSNSGPVESTTHS